MSETNATEILHSTTDHFHVLVCLAVDEITKKKFAKCAKKRVVVLVRKTVNPFYILTR